MLMTSLNKLGQFSSHDRRLLFQAVLLLPIIHFALSFLGYYRLQRLMDKLFPLKLSNTPRPETEILHQAREIARIVSIAAQHGFFRASCLRKSLLVWWFLRRQGVQSNICFGVQMIDHQLEAHAWVEYKDNIINDSASFIKNYQALRDILPPTNSGL
jgi:hypothetical protein